VKGFWVSLPPPRVMMRMDRRGGAAYRAYADEESDALDESG